MNMQTIHLDVSSDIFDKLMSFLEILPKNKVRILKKDDFKGSQLQENKEDFIEYFANHPVNLDMDLKFLSRV